VAHIDYSFEMSGNPDAAQALFMRDITPELARDASFHVVREHPGGLVFDDALTEADADAPGEQPGLGDEEELTDEPPAAGSFIIGEGLSTKFTAPRPLELLGEDLLSRHLHVDFSPGVSGTVVRVHGRARRALRDALQRLGTTGHWPETADRPHD
jgi:hypothetical protein